MSSPNFGFFGRGSLTEAAGKLKKESGSVSRKAMAAAQGRHRDGRLRLAAGGRGAVASDELRAVGLFHGEGGIRLETAAAAGFVSAHGPDDD